MPEASYGEEVIFIKAANFKNAALLCVPLLYCSNTFQCAVQRRSAPLLSSKFQVSAGAFFGRTFSTGQKYEFAAWYLYAPTNRLLLTTRVDWFNASGGDYSGGLWDIGLGAQFQISDHFGIGAEYGFFELDGKIKDSSWNGKAEISSAGLQLFLTANW